MGARVAEHELFERLGDGFEQRDGETRRRHAAERVAIERGVLGGDPARFAGDAQLHDASACCEFGDPFRRIAFAALRDLVAGEIADPAQQIGERVGMRGAQQLRATLQLVLDIFERARVEQIAQLFLAEQVAQHVAIELQRLRAALGGGRIALVEIGGRVGEDERTREGRRHARLGAVDAHFARADPAQQVDEAGHVEDVLQATSIGLEDDREARELARDGEQVLRLQALHPERRARARPAPRQQQRARGVLAEHRREHGGVAELLDDHVLDQLGIGNQRIGIGQFVGVGEAQHDAVVARHGVHLVADPGRELRFERQRPRRVHARAERRQDADAPVAEFVAEALDRDGAVGRQRAGGLALLAQVIDQVARGERVEVLRLAQP